MGKVGTAAKLILALRAQTLGGPGLGKGVESVWSSHGRHLNVLLRDPRSVEPKQAARLSAMLRGRLRYAAGEPHIWWGVSVENRRHGLPRIDELRRAPAAVRFLSLEPLLEDLGFLSLDRIQWVIVGGESGPGARPMKESWVLSIRDQCRRARVAFFFKQWGGVRKSAQGRLLHGATYDEFPATQPAAP